MPAAASAVAHGGLTRTLCLVILVIMIAAVGYAAYIAISNYPRIGV